MLCSNTWYRGIRWIFLQILQINCPSNCQTSSLLSCITSLLHCGCFMTNVKSDPEENGDVVLTSLWWCYVLLLMLWLCRHLWELVELLLGRWCDISLGLLPKFWWQPGGEHRAVQWDVRWCVSLLRISLSSWTACYRLMFWESMQKLMWGIEVQLSCLWVIFRQGSLKGNTINIQAK